MTVDRLKGGCDDIIEMAWADRVSFEAIFDATGFTEADVIEVMRGNLRPSSFRRWRRRVRGRPSKHRGLSAMSSDL